MTYYYQLIFLGNKGNYAFNEIRGRFQTLIKEFGMDETCVKIIRAENFDVDYSNCQPTFVFFWEIQYIVMTMWQN